MSSARTLTKDFALMLERELNKHFVITQVKPEETEVEPATGRVRLKDGGPAFVTLSVEKVPVDSKSLTAAVRRTMEIQCEQLAHSIKTAGFGRELRSLDGPHTFVEPRIDVPGFLLSVWISLPDERGLVSGGTAPMTPLVPS